LSGTKKTQEKVHNKKSELHNTKLKDIEIHQDYSDDDENWDDIDDMTIKSILAICTIIFLFLSSGLIYIAWNNWWNDELIGPGTFLTSRQENYEKLTNFHEIELNGDGVIVCIVDSGIDLTHPDLSDIKLEGWKDFVNSRTDIYDDQGHGTMMAGIMVAKGGLTGLATEVKLLIAKALSIDGTGTDQDVSDAINWCVSNNADIISLSLGGAPGVLPSLLGGDAVENSVEEAIDLGIFVVAAAGNDGEEENDDDVNSPCSVEDVICVGGVGIEGDIWSGSSKGSNNFQLIPPKLSRQDPDKKPELVAPAESVPVLISTNSGSNEPSQNTYGTASGTSAATVYASSALALMLQANPDLSRNGTEGGSLETIEQVKQWIKESVLPKNNQEEHDDYYGYGILQVDSLINRAT
tara:strand:+ start:13235 stop:14458 length:1224 start_codon:yes stop_codon:yes gene_type:complete